MKHRGKLAIVTLAVTVFFATTSVFAAPGTSFSGTLPANQGDTEISTVARSNEATNVKYFSIKITSLGSGTSYVRAWAEKQGSWGGNNGNLSDPYNQVVFDNAYHTINYSSVPAKGTNVILNLDNPVLSSSTVSVSGEWNPN